jgi:hypothetical protein
MQKDQELNYLTKSLLHHPSPYIIYELDGSIAWANIAANYIFNSLKPGRAFGCKN